MALQTSLLEALRLTRAGNPLEATALIRTALSGGGAVEVPQPETGDTIELTPERVSFTGSAEPRPAREGRFEERSFSHGGKSLGYRLYLPRQSTAGMPLVVMLHGCTQSPEDFARGTGMNRIADELGFAVAYPRQTQAANPQKCWNWFRPDDQQRDRGEPALIAGLTREVTAAHGLDPARVYVAGLSAGGAAAAIMAAAYPDLYAAVGIHSGLGCGSARDLPSALMAMKQGGTGAPARRGAGRFVPVITFHGDRDTTVNEANARAIIAAASAAAGVPLEVRTETGRSAGGRGYRRDLSVTAGGEVLIEQWTIHGSGHAWSGGDAGGSYTDPTGPDASREMARFFLERRLG